MHKIHCYAFSLLLCLSLWKAAPAEAEPIVSDGNFDAPPLSWSYWQEDKSRSKAYSLPGKDGNALCLENSDSFGRVTAQQKLKIAQQSPEPLVLRGWSRVVSCDSGTNLVKAYYSVMLERIFYNDNSREPNFTYLSFDSGLVGPWQFASALIVPPKPMKSAEIICRWSNTQGSVLFDSVSLGSVPYVDEGCALSAGSSCELKAGLRNPSASAAFKVRAVAKSLEDGKESVLAKSAEIALAPGAATELKLPCQAPRSALSHAVFVDLEDAATGELYFRRSLAWHGAETLPASILHEGGGMSVVETSPDVRIYPASKFSGPARKGIAISAALGEFESSQIGVSLPAAKSLKFAFSEFKDAKGRAFDARGFKIEYIDYVNVVRTTSGCKPDSYPDKLVPSVDGSFQLPAGSSGLWLTFHVPRDAAPGVYSGSLRISGGASAEIPVEVKVLNFSIPADRDISVVAAFSRSDLLREMPEAYRSGKLAEPLYKDLEEHFADYVDFYYSPKLAYEDGAMKVENMSDMDFSFKALQAHGFKYMRLPVPMFGDASAAAATWEGAKIPSPEFEKRVTDSALLFQRLAKESSCRQKFFYRSYDEPKDLKRLEYLCGLVRKALPDIPILSTSRLGEKGEFEKFKGSIDIFCPHIIYMADALKQNLDALSACPDKTLFIYHNHLLLLDYQRLNGRALPWIARHYKAKGIMLWSINAWKIADASAGKTSLPGYQYTEGALVYPGKDKLLASVRWQLLREGLEDFEYLCMLERLAPSLSDRPGLHARAVKLLDDSDKMVSSWQSFSRDYEAYHKLHQEIGALLDEAAAK